jgi:DNA invertase Pin-like site-specific DNA recombinase
MIATSRMLGTDRQAFAQFDNDCRSDRTRAGMKAALELGRWVFLAPLGYLNAPRAIGKSLMQDPERAPIVPRTLDAGAMSRVLESLRNQRLAGPGREQPHRVLGQPTVIASER